MNGNSGREDGAIAESRVEAERLGDDELLPGDAYMEGSYVVFTAQYHLRRGYCCNSGCRHCPYQEP